VWTPVPAFGPIVHACSVAAALVLGARALQQHSLLTGLGDGR
jgi:hypothetical protein